MVTIRPSATVSPRPLFQRWPLRVVLARVARVAVAAVLAAAAVPLVAPPALAQPAAEAPAEGRAIATAATVSGDAGASAEPAALLTHCQVRLSRCEQDAAGSVYLLIAFFVLWVVVLYYFTRVRRRQQLLIAEMRELRARLARLHEGPGPGDAASP